MTNFHTTSGYTYYGITGITHQIEHYMTRQPDNDKNGGQKE